MREIDALMSSVYERDYSAPPLAPEAALRSRAEVQKEIAALEADMKAAASNMEFERAAAVRDSLKALRARDLGLLGADEAQG